MLQYQSCDLPPVVCEWSPAERRMFQKSREQSKPALCIRTERCALCFLPVLLGSPIGSFRAHSSRPHLSDPTCAGRLGAIPCQTGMLQIQTTFRKPECHVHHSGHTHYGLGSGTASSLIPRIGKLACQSCGESSLTLITRFLRNTRKMVFFLAFEGCLSQFGKYSRNHKDKPSKFAFLHALAKLPLEG